MMLEDEIRFFRNQYSNKDDSILERDISLYKAYIQQWTIALGEWREKIKVLETILDERMP